MALQKREFASEPVTQVEFTLTNPDYPFVAASTLGNCRLLLEEFIPRGEDAYAEFFSVTGTDAGRVVAIAREHENIDPNLLNAYDDGGLFEFLVDGNCPAVFLGERNALPRDVFSVDGVGRLTAEIPSGEDVATIVDSFLDAHPDADLVAKREQPYVTPMFSHREYRHQLHEQLTDRQREVLDNAHEMGYYRWPRGITAEELANDLDISSATLHKHLRAAERKLVSAFFDGSPTESRKSTSDAS